MIKLVLFDWNGVIIADAQACLDADNYAIKKFGGRPMSAAKRREAFVIPAAKFFAAQGVPEEILRTRSQEVSGLFHEYYEERAKRLRTRRGARELLEFLGRRDIAAVIISNHTVEGIESQLKRLDLDDFFDEVLANDAKDAALTTRNKHERAATYLKRSGFKKSEALIIGDSPEEIEIGHALDLTAVAITGGYCSTRRLQAARPDFLIHNLGELRKIIEQ